MRIHILAVGPMKSGPERDLVDDYIGRATNTGRAIGVRTVIERSVASGGSADAEAARLLSAVPDGARLLMLDEGGKDVPSEALARQLADARDGGCGDICFVIGGADGLGAALKAQADGTLAFGRQTWPHKLVRAMLAEQIYRSLTILAGTPYHKA